MSPLERLKLTLRALMETGLVLGLAYWGVHVGDDLSGKILLGVGAPVLGFGFWGAVDFRRAGRLAEPLRLAQELIVSGLAAVALYAAGQHVLGAALVALTIVYHLLVTRRGHGSLPVAASADRVSRPANDPERNGDPWAHIRKAEAGARRPGPQGVGGISSPSSTMASVRRSAIQRFSPGVTT